MTSVKTTLLQGAKSHLKSAIDALDRLPDAELWVWELSLLEDIIDTIEEHKAETKHEQGQQ